MKTRQKKWLARTIVVMGLTWTLLSCGPGPYGFSRYYVPGEPEEAFHKQAREYPYGIVAANPDRYRDQLIAWFGIVQRIEQTKDGKYQIRFSYNRHKERHLCAEQSSSSCRVTVHFKPTGYFSARLQLRAEDVKPGLDKIQTGTLMRLFGRVRCSEREEGQLQCDYDEEGGLILEAVHYRQWPVRYYATTRAAAALRR
jgi:hypothetical protein